MNDTQNITPAKTLYDIFKKNPESAKKSYGMKYMTIQGFITYVGPDVYALPSVELSEAKGGKSRILCVLPATDYLKLRKYSKGELATVTGEVRGFYEKGDMVLMKNCIVK